MCLCLINQLNSFIYWSTRLFLSNTKPTTSKLHHIALQKQTSRSKERLHKIVLAFTERRSTDDSWLLKSRRLADKLPTIPWLWQRGKADCASVICITSDISINYISKIQANSGWFFWFSLNLHLQDVYRVTVCVQYKVTL